LIILSSYSAPSSILLSSNNRHIRFQEAFGFGSLVSGCLFRGELAKAGTALTLLVSEL